MSEFRRLPTAEETDQQVHRLMMNTMPDRAAVKVSRWKYDKLIDFARTYSAYDQLLGETGDIAEDLFAEIDIYLDRCAEICTEIRASGVIA